MDGLIALKQEAGIDIIKWCLIGSGRFNFIRASLIVILTGTTKLVSGVWDHFIKICTLQAIKIETCSGHRMDRVDGDGRWPLLQTPPTRRGQGTVIKAEQRRRALALDP
ncbi:hypothetical protein OPV22_026760 [Ensete ventricosum]|uniref:Uncharacterized protein n=1 Tax=Ensete ventricosum TaxID=4639 RepID=A0AAV8Q3E2_ENSVE|nr:hypothetical protein OPV22_026760 [Ensete ventricosum]